MSRSFTLNDGTQIPWVAFGTGTALYEQDASASVQTAIKAGFTHLDGAQMYKNENSLGSGITASGKPRSELYILTKLDELPPNTSITETLQSSLKQLGTDHVDMFLVHDPTKHDIKKAWKEMEELKRKGLTKSIGVSNFDPEHLSQVLEIATVPPAVNQIEYHAHLIKASKPLVDLCKKHNIIIESYGGLSPLTRVEGSPVQPVIEAIRSRLEKDTGAPVSAGQIVTKWLNQLGMVVVTTSSKEARLRETLQAISLPNLTAEEINSIEEAGSKIHKRIFMVHTFKN